MNLNIDDDDDGEKAMGRTSAPKKEELTPKHPNWAKAVPKEALHTQPNTVVNDTALHTQPHTQPNGVVQSQKNIGLPMVLSIYEERIL